MIAQDIRICAMKVVVKEILNDDKILKETVTKIVGYWPFYFGIHPDGPKTSTFISAQVPYLGYVPRNVDLPKTMEDAQRILSGELQLGEQNLPSL